VTTVAPSIVLLLPARSFPDAAMNNATSVAGIMREPGRRSQGDLGACAESAR
jgi:hypothetical protein